MPFDALPQDIELLDTAPMLAMTPAERGKALAWFRDLDALWAARGITSWFVPDQGADYDHACLVVNSWRRHHGLCGTSSARTSELISKWLGGMSGPDWNNHPDRTFEEVHAFVRSAIATIEAAQNMETTNAL